MPHPLLVTGTCTEFNRKHIGTRYIEVFTASAEEAQTALVAMDCTKPALSRLIPCLFPFLAELPQAGRGEALFAHSQAGQSRGEGVFACRSAAR